MSSFGNCQSQKLSPICKIAQKKRLRGGEGGSSILCIFLCLPMEIQLWKPQDFRNHHLWPLEFSDLGRMNGLEKGSRSQNHDRSKGSKNLSRARPIGTYL